MGNIVNKFEIEFEFDIPSDFTTIKTEYKPLHFKNEYAPNEYAPVQYRSYRRPFIH
jgi:hypothetical protein